MPRLGDIEKGINIGKHGGSATSYFIWSDCIDCGLERWVICINGIPRNKRCKHCGGIYASHYLPRNKGNKNPAWNGGIVNLKGYIGIRYPNHPRSNNGYVMQHILVWEEYNQRQLPIGWVIHHLNGIKNDNRIENLLALPRTKHHTELVNNALKNRIIELEFALGMGNIF